MKTPICEICLKSGILCPGCQGKLTNGDISELDVNISKLLYKLISEYNIPKDITFIKAWEFDDIIILVVGINDVGSVVGKGGKILKILQKELQRKIRVVEDTDDVRKMVNDLLYPARVIGVNIIYLPKGQKRKIRISHDDEKRLPMELSKAKDIIRTLTGEEIDIIVD